MNTGNIKKFAPKARTRFIETMTRQAARYGISSGHKGEGHVAPTEVRGDVMLISALDGQTHSFPKALRGPREALAKWVTQLGFEQAMEQAAYSWFNRLCAIRFMELKGYLDHGRRVLSHPDHEGGFQILDDCLEIDLPGLDTARVRELKLDGTQDEALYRELLLAQCHALHEAMPFLFEPLDDASELLLPNNLTKTDSLIRELVEAIPEEDWHDVEVIGWLYQFYIAEKKDQVIGKVVKSEDIPAATQLFTPNWIVQYLVQNSVGRQWLQTYPDSPLKGEMPYYIEPAEQEPEVQAQLDAITPASIDPETIKVLDPACGSGHILVEAYNVLKAIYEERGYRSRDIPKLILENNLFGLDIDDRAAQLAGFALLMKAREDDRRIFSRGIRLNVMALQSTQHLDASTLWRDLNLSGDWHQGQSQSLFESEQKELSSNDSTYKAIVDLIELFQDAKTFGSLIEVPNSFEVPLKTLMEVLSERSSSGDTMQKTAARQLVPIVQQAWVLAQRYDAVVANPPYMGSKGMNKALKDYAKTAYPNSKSDLFAIFMEHGFSLLNENAFNAMVTMQSWMFLSSYEKMREALLENSTIETMVHMGNGVMKIAFGTNATVFRNCYISGMKVSFSYAEAGDISDQGEPYEFPVKNERLKAVAPDDFKKIPGSPVAYWIGASFAKTFDQPKLDEIITTEGQNKTANNDKYVRMWWEVSRQKIGQDKMWITYAKGGEYRKWFGNMQHVVDWSEEARVHYRKDSSCRIVGENFWYKEGLTWTDITSGGASFRYLPEGGTFDMSGPTAFFESRDEIYRTLPLLNSSYTAYLLPIINPTLHAQLRDIKSIPQLNKVRYNDRCIFIGKECSKITKHDWDEYEGSLDFKENSLVEKISFENNAKESYQNIRGEWISKVDEIRHLEEENNSLFVKVYNLQNELKIEVPLEDVTLTCNPYYRYGGNRPEEELENLLQCDTLKELVSYAIGCMMGRYSLEKPGLILASQGETVRDYFAQIPEPSFSPDDNAIIPLTDQEWFTDDATNRFRDFVRTVWGDEHLQENLDFVAESLCLHAIKPKKGEAALDTIRRYLSTQFYKDHLRTYKKRPIYWLFSSGKQKAFECLVYLHRYNESTLAEMRTDYVIPLSTKLASYVEKLEQNKERSASAAEAKRIEKELSKLYKQQAELNAFDEKLRHYADQRISLDLDDGVKVNYGKFGDLLAEVKAVTGEKPK
ncbi:Methyltransferase domain-containing protein [Halomonas shengliensis]|uniref:site-specific DNA-methyltransferase (adenine-specific) n=1 Tax=Halomonas shengliensis TaxID=419597 RepID=A0A1H0D9S7_9GAMM|nr:BREX-1 system adenine-specific DNA-methyltransferase PglX [Halomonas shengliensis]SDN66706.1 Methyltransferase domain-containing protein [Halomonas shengliensis]